ncbi:ras protein [Mycena galericulata]|nr:ras protein [Mycena galericulata]
MGTHFDELLNVAILGDSKVGKESFGCRFALDCMPPGKYTNSILSTSYPDPTWDNEPYRKALEVDGRRCFVSAGESCLLFFSLLWASVLISHQRRTRLIQSEAVILMYSVSSRASFERLPELRNEAFKNRKRAFFVLVGNKSDVDAGQREVTREEGQAAARELGCGFAETSAKTGAGVEEIFMELVRAHRSTALLEKKPRRRGSRCLVM